MFESRSPRPKAVSGPPQSYSAATRRLTRGQGGVLASLVLGVGVGVALVPRLTFDLIHHAGWLLFGTVSLWKLISVGLSRAPVGPTAPADPERLPAYTVLIALYREAPVAGQLIRNLQALDYPRDRLEVLFLLEASDAETLLAIQAAAPPAWMRPVIVPPGPVQTKPNALNHGLNLAVGELAVIYDAEDEPDPRQLREAAARFAAGPAKLACLQAPLRIRVNARACPDDDGLTALLCDQFAAEYAALFEVGLPALARLGWPFPLGGTSNHFRVRSLRDVGGWDPYNVTEDADLGYRFAAHGFDLGTLSCPTWESPPRTLKAWLPQRTRWLKGHVQTWGVQMRRPRSLGLKGAASLQLTLGQALVASACHAPALAWLLATVLIRALQGLPAALPPADVGLLAFGYGCTLLTLLVGARRAGIPAGPRLGLAPAYWALSSLALLHAAWQLARHPFHWDKTDHAADPAKAVLEPA